MTDNDESLADYARQLFGREDEQPAEAPDPARNNTSPREGQPTPPIDPDQQLRDYVRDLFAPND